MAAIHVKLGDQLHHVAEVGTQYEQPDGTATKAVAAADGPKVVVTLVGKDEPHAALLAIGLGSFLLDLLNFDSFLNFNCRDLLSGGGQGHVAAADPLNQLVRDPTSTDLAIRELLGRRGTRVGCQKVEEGDLILRGQVDRVDGTIRDAGARCHNISLAAKFYCLHCLCSLVDVYERHIRLLSVKDNN